MAYGTYKLLQGIITTIPKRLLSSKLEIQIAKTKDEIAYLDAQGAEAIYMNTGNNTGFMLIREGASIQTIAEETIHHAQNVTYGEEYVLANQERMEIEAQDLLLEMGKKQGWSTEEMDRIRDAKKAWEAKLNLKNKKNEGGN